MSDLTPAMRAEWRQEAKSAGFLGDHDADGYVKDLASRILSLLDALEEVESQQAKLRKTLEGIAFVSAYEEKMPGNIVGHVKIIIDNYIRAQAKVTALTDALRVAEKEFAQLRATIVEKNRFRNIVGEYRCDDCGWIWPEELAWPVKGEHDCLECDSLPLLHIIDRALAAISATRKT